MAEGVPKVNMAVARGTDPRLQQILAALTSFATEDWTAPPQASGEGDGYDQIIDGLNQMARAALANRVLVDHRFEMILDVLLSILALDFSKRVPPIGDGSNLDALGFGLNNLIDELAVSMFSRAYVDNIFSSMLDPLLVLDADLSIKRANRAAEQLFGYEPEAWPALPLTTLFADASIIARMKEVRDKVEPRGNAETMGIDRGGRSIPLLVSVAPMSDNGETGIVCVFRDITERKRAEEALRQNVKQAEMIRMQADAIAELSTPIIPISERVLVMPLIGKLDSERAQQVIEALLNGIFKNRAKVIILDITGVALVDSRTASTLVRAAQAVKLIGAKLILTGVHPDAAQQLVRLGSDLDGMLVQRTLQDGIALAMKQ